MKTTSNKLFMSVAILSLAFITSCNDKEDPKPQLRTESVSDWYADEHYTNVDIIFQLSPENGEVKEAGYAVGVDGTFYRDNSADYSFYDIPITSFSVPEGNMVRIGVEGLIPDTYYEFLFYYIDGIDKVLVHEWFETDYLRPLGINSGMVKGKGSEIQMVNVFHYDHEDIKFFLGDMEIVPQSVKEAIVYNTSELSFTAPDFEDYDSLEIYGMLGDLKIPAGKAQPYGNGSPLYYVDVDKNYIHPSDWKVVASHDEIIFPGEEYVQIGDMVYFNGAIRDVAGDWLMSVDLETYKVERIMLEEELLFHLMAIDGKLYGVDLNIIENENNSLPDSSVFIVNEIDPVSKTMQPVDTISPAFDRYNYGRFFCHGEYAYFLSSGFRGSSQRMNLFTGEVTEMIAPSVPEGKSFTIPNGYRITENYVLFESYRYDRDLVEVVIYDVSSDSWTYSDYPSSNYGTMLVFEYEDIPAFALPDQESYFYLPFSHEWKKLNDCPYPSDEIAAWSYTGRMFSTTKGSLHIDRDAVLLFDPIGISTIGITVD